MNWFKIIDAIAKNDPLHHSAWILLHGLCCMDYVAWIVLHGLCCMD